MNSKHLRVLCLSACALMGLMAVNASAAQAKWLLLRNGVSVSSLTLVAEVGEGNYLVPNLGSNVHCEGGEGVATVSLSEEGKTLSGAGQGVLTGCADLNFEEVCTVRSPGNPVGTIEGSGSGVADMSTEGDLIVEVASSLEEPFTEIIREGEECPLVEIDSRVTGRVEVEILESLVEKVAHEAHLVLQETFYGENPAELHDGEGGPLSGMGFEVNGAATSVHLVEL